jgi:hypothetical protein
VPFGQVLVQKTAKFYITDQYLAKNVNIVHLQPMSNKKTLKFCTSGHFCSKITLFVCFLKNFMLMNNTTKNFAIF